MDVLTSCRRRRPLAGVPSLALAALTATLAASPAVVRAQAPVASETAVKAAFVYNFAKFTDWHGRAPGTTLTVCVVGNQDLAAALTDTIQVNRVGGHAVAVRKVSASEAVGACDVVVVPAAEMRRAGAALRTLRTLPVLTVGEGENFARQHGIIGLFAEDGRLRFAINPEAADRAGIKLSSRLLSLARIVRTDDAP